MYSIVETLFIFKNAVFGDIIHAILSHCNSKSKQTRDQAISLYIFLIERNNSIVNNIARIKLQTTIGTALSFFVSLTASDHEDCRAR